MSEQEVNSGLGELRERVGNLEAASTQLKKDLADNTAVTKRIDENTKGLVDALANLEGFTKVINAVAKFTKPILAFATVVAGLWFTFKSGISAK